MFFYTILRIAKLLSVENDEKSYSFDSVLSIAEENNIMMVTDFHHERCYQRRSNPTVSMSEIDSKIYNNIDRIVNTYVNKLSLPLFHISSPLGGWCGKFKEECSHADYIAKNDYPFLLQQISNRYKKDFILDIEAKHKECAVLEVEKFLR